MLFWNEQALICELNLFTLRGNKLSKYLNETRGTTEKINKLTEELRSKREKRHDERMEAYEKHGFSILKRIEKLTYAVDSTAKRSEKYYLAITRPLKNFKENLRRKK